MALPIKNKVQFKEIGSQQYWLNVSVLEVCQTKPADQWPRLSMTSLMLLVRQRICKCVPVAVSIEWPLEQNNSLKGLISVSYVLNANWMNVSREKKWAPINCTHNGRQCQWCISTGHCNQCSTQSGRQWPVSPVWMENGHFIVVHWLILKSMWQLLLLATIQFSHSHFVSA